MKRSNFFATVRSCNLEELDSQPDFGKWNIITNIMGTSLNQIFSVLTEPAGSLIYHLILVFSIAGALQSAFVHWRSSEFPQARRTIFGLVMLLVAQIVLFLVSGIGIQGLINLQLFLPPLDRAVTLFSLVWLIWLWAFPEPSRPADAGTWLLSLLVLSALGLSLAAYSTQSPFSSYNLTTSDSYWQLASIGFSLLGLLLLAVRRPNGWGYGIAVFLLSFRRSSPLYDGRAHRRRLPRRGPAGAHGSLPDLVDSAPALPHRLERADLRQAAGCTGWGAAQVQHRPEDLPCLAGAGGRIQH